MDWLKIKLSTMRNNASHFVEQSHYFSLNSFRCDWPYWTWKSWIWHFPKGQRLRKRRPKCQPRALSRRLEGCGRLIRLSPSSQPGSCPWQIKGLLSQSLDGTPTSTPKPDQALPAGEARNAPPSSELESLGHVPETSLYLGMDGCHVRCDPWLICWFLLLISFLTFGEWLSIHWKDWHLWTFGH